MRDFKELIWTFDWLKSWGKIQELSHSHDFSWNRNERTHVTAEPSIYDVLPLNSTSPLILGDNAIIIHKIVHWWNSSPREEFNFYFTGVFG